MRISKGIRAWLSGAGSAGALFAPLLGFAQTNARLETITYKDDLSGWVLGQVERRTVNGIEVERTLYDSRMQPQQVFAFGKTQQSFEYHPEGVIRTVRDGNGNPTVFTQWKRGIPQRIQYADGTVQTAVVDDWGQITSITDENGFVTNYGYDEMGRLAVTQYPVGDPIAWNTRDEDYSQLTATSPKPAGVSAGQWMHLVAEGNYRKVTYFDAMWRPVLVQQYDSTDTSNTMSSVSTRYDLEGRVAFKSYPSSSTTGQSAGIHRGYDVLGRLTAVTQDSELGLLTTATRYEPGLRVVTTNPRSQTTTNTYVAYDMPGYDVLARSEMPEGKIVEITRNAVDKPLSLKQGSANGSHAVVRHYVYDQYMQLCKTIEPETRATVMDYDGAGNLLWSASGLELLSTDPAQCNVERSTAFNSGRAARRSYDSRNRLKTLTFPDGNGNQVYAYEADGLVREITTSDGTGPNPVINRYTYNRRRLLTGETQVQDIYSWSVSYGYDANGHRTSVAYPAGLSLSYTVDALGRPKQITGGGRTWASGASYYPNGGLKHFTYGNGVVHTTQQNARQLPSRVTSSGVADYGYGYDRNGNASSITDYARGSTYNRSMTYDDLDRLETATSGSFGGTDSTHRYTYDVLDNITSWKLAGVKDYARYYYEPGTQRLGNIYNSAGAMSVALEYDDQGNVRQKNQQAYRFDFGNRLRETVGKETYRYDGHGRRVLAHGTGATPGKIFSLYSKEGQLLWERNERDGKRVQNIYLGGSLIGQRMRPVSADNETITFHHTDALGSPVAVTGLVREIKERTAWEPYGAAIGKPNYQGIGYTGHVMDGATGLTYMQQRYYDPQVGRFLSVDPVTAYETGDMSLFNRYRYAANNPYRFVDPDGRREGSAERFSAAVSDALVEGRMHELEPLVGPALTVTTALAGATPVVGPYLSGGINALRATAPESGQGTSGISNPVPSTLARVIPDGIDANSLGAPGARDVFVTAADDIAGMTAPQIANQLTIPNSATGFRIIEFATPQAGVASPVFRMNPGFVGGGRTAGGAREFVVPNGPIPAGATIRTVAP